MNRQTIYRDEQHVEVSRLYHKVEPHHVGERFTHLGREWLVLQIQTTRDSEKHERVVTLREEQ